ncbi:hypothetical protein Tco_0936119, partial [Tanacetum coccineum]
SDAVFQVSLFSNPPLPYAPPPGYPTPDSSIGCRSLVAPASFPILSSWPLQHHDPMVDVLEPLHGLCSITTQWSMISSWPLQHHDLVVQLMIGRKHFGCYTEEGLLQSRINGFCPLVFACQKTQAQSGA